MILHVLRALFVLLMAAVGFFFIYQNPPGRDASWIQFWIPPAISCTVAVLLVCVDILAPARRKLAIFSGMFLGLIVGLAFAYIVSFAVQVLVQQYVSGDKQATAQFINMLVASRRATSPSASFFRPRTTSASSSPMSSSASRPKALGRSWSIPAC